ncbi:ETR1 Enoyl-[acyl-carrier-protein] reductase 1 [Candida maltosa Xu316]|uniref:enoyl-[acyl-carrier-protein] reductase n=1 Tax=Candida maltosa (strain Xu316) TaxID=1245528 RepID=M3K2K5_CANMX|nr:hypothetical protein G210_5717 [Candida maltosa Xu316]
MPSIITGRAYTYVTPWDADLTTLTQETIFEIDESRLETNDMVVKTLATPINPSDVSQILGGYNKPIANSRLGTKESHPVHVGGNEGVFEVIHVGSEITNYKVGDIVIPKMPGFGTWRTYALVTVNETDLTPFIKVNGLSIDQAAIISINPSTAYQLLHQFIDDWKSGDWIIQNAGNSQASKYLTQLAHLKGVNVISVVRDGKLEEVADELYRFHATKVITESELLDNGFSIDKLTDGGNVRLALNSLGGKSVPGLVKSLSEDGTLITYGVLAGGEINYNGALQLFKNLTTKAYWLTANTKKNPSYKIETVNKLAELFSEDKIEVVPYVKVKYDSTKQDLKSCIKQTITDSKTQKHVIFYE